MRGRWGIFMLVVLLVAVGGCATTQSRRAIPWSILCIVLAITGCAQISKKAGVENRWRDQNIVLQEGVTAATTLAQLGPPSQIIALSARTVLITYLKRPKAVSSS